jgi:hypothetical protein
VPTIVFHFFAKIGSSEESVGENENLRWACQPSSLSGNGTIKPRMYCSLLNWSGADIVPSVPAMENEVLPQDLGPSNWQVRGHRDRLMVGGPQRPMKGRTLDSGWRAESSRAKMLFCERSTDPSLQHCKADRRHAVFATFV